MEDFEKTYGDLTNEEYLGFLNEIKSGDEEMEEAQSEAIQRIGREEECAGLSETEENARIEAYYGTDAWRKFGKYFFGKPEVVEAQKKARVTRAARFQKVKEARIAIQRMAFNQEYVRLSDTIGDNNLRLLITLLTAEHTRMMEKYTIYINKRLTTLLNPLIPRRIRVCRMLYPEVMRESPGFLYRASEEYGDGRTFWATPDIPCYFKQNREQAELQKSVRYTNYLINIDKAIAAHGAHSNERADKELRYTSLLIRKSVRTYFDLLRLNPFWFEILFNDLKDKIDNL